MDVRPKPYFSSSASLESKQVCLGLAILRPRQWIKNGFVFLGILLQLRFPSWSQIIQVIIGAILFCGISSTIYIFNDLIDFEKDRIHPEKKKRPIASGQISKKVAISLMVVLGTITLISGYFFNRNCGIILTVYVLVNIMYSLQLKEYIFIDLFCISVGFTLRVLLGFILLGLPITEYKCLWFLLFIMFFTLFIGLGKRKSELVILSAQSSSHRGSLKQYSLELISEVMPILITCTLITYIMYTIESKNVMIVFSTVFLLYGILRYQYLYNNIYALGKPENIIFIDRPMRICILVWGFIYIGAAIERLIAGV